MTFRSLLHKSWQSLQYTWYPDDRKKLLEILCQGYIEETQHVSQFAEHARQMYIPQFHDKLIRFSAKEQEYAQWLSEKSPVGGGEIPWISFTVKRWKNKMWNKFGIA